jgi:ATP-dependent Clp protease ATP-binding subunit ClpC
MFERYTEKARRVIFFGRYEASQFGSPFIETEHLLLGLLREDKALTNRFLRSHASVESIRKQIEAQTTIREKVSTSVDLPVSDECKRVLAHAADEAERLGHKHIGTEHLLLGLLREERSFAAALLTERGLKVDAVRKELERLTPQVAVAQERPEGQGFGRGGAAPPVAETGFSRDLTQAALNGELNPVIGRGQELDGLIEVLGSIRLVHPLLVGEPGAGKTAIVEELAQRISAETVPVFLAEKKVLALDLRPASDSVWIERLASIMRIREQEAGVIFFVGQLSSLLGTNAVLALAVGGILQDSHWQAKNRCIATSSREDFEQCRRMAPWLEHSFQPIYVRPLAESDALKVLELARARLEKFHELTYSEEALVCAVRSSAAYLPNRVLPGKALELLDAAGARIRMRAGSPPAEILEVQKRVRHISQRLEDAIQGHEFEKARFYSEEERKGRESLRLLMEKLPAENRPPTAVSRQDIEEVIAGWTNYPFRP